MLHTTTVTTVLVANKDLQEADVYFSHKPITGRTRLKTGQGVVRGRATARIDRLTNRSFHAMASAQPGDTVWLARRGDLTDYFSNPATRTAVIDTWNKENTPQITETFSDATAVVSYFQTRAGLRRQLFELMLRHGFIDPRVRKASFAGTARRSCAAVRQLCKRWR